MKKISLILLAILMQSGAFAQTDYDQRVYTFRTTALPGAADRYEQECIDAMVAAGLEPFPVGGEHSAAMRVMLQSIHTKKTNGELKKPIKKIGEALICQDWDTYVFSGVLNFVPVFYVVEIDGITFSAVGGATHPYFGQLAGGGQMMTPQGQFGFFYPAPGVPLFNVSTTILPSLPITPGISDGTGGNMTMNSIINSVGDERFVTEGIGVIRFLDPIDE